jgi:hypothetical protein
VWTQSTVCGPRATPVHGGPRIGPQRLLARAQPSGSSVPWQLTGAWIATRRRRIGGRTMAPCNDGVGAREEQRR